MILLDKWLTVKRIRSTMKELGNTMAAYKTYEKSVQLASELNAMFENSPNVKEVLFKKEDMRSQSSINYLNAIGRKDIVNFLVHKIPNYSPSDLQLFKVLVNAEQYRIKPENIENIALAGGGAKCLSYPGIYRKIVESGVKFKRISGTSGGAISALVISLGLTPKTCEEVVLQYDFTRFMYQSNINKPILKDTMMTNMMHQSAYLREFKEQFDKRFLDYLIKNPIFFEKLGVPYVRDPNVATEKENNQLIEYYYNEVLLNVPDLKSKLRFLPLDNYLKDVIKESKTAALEIYVRSLDSEKDQGFVKELIAGMNTVRSNRYGELLVEFVRLKRGDDIIEEFFGDLIEGRLRHLGVDFLEKISEGLSESDRLRNITFKEFEKIRLITAGNPRWDLKDLAICICERKSSNPLKIFDKDNYEQIDVYSGNPDPLYSEMPLKTAVRISMNLPGAFSAYEYKNKNYVDGGVRANFPMHVYDKTMGLDRRTTVGFCVAPEENYSRTEDAGKVLNPERKSVLTQNNILKRGIAIVSNYVSDMMTQIHGNKLDNNKPLDFFDLTRIGVINVKNIDTTAFNLNQETKIDLFKQGYYAATDLLTPSYNAQLRHFVERMKVLHRKVENDMNVLFSISPKKNRELNTELSDMGLDVTKIKDYMKSLQEEVTYDLGGRINKKTFKP
jgi:predicted acylesterase/phospholipase RssA